MTRRLKIAVMILAVPALVRAGPPFPPPPPLPHNVRVVVRPLPTLIADLDARSYRQRQRATRELFRAGAGAAGPLGEAARTQSLEVAARAIAVLERMYTAGEIVMATASEEVLEGLVTKGPRRVSRRARAVLTAHTELRQQRAVEQIRRLGGVFKDADDNVVDPNSRGLLGRPIMTLQLGKGWVGGDRGLRFVRRLTQLQSLLIIQGVKASSEELDGLNAALPMLRIVRRGQALLGVRSFSMPCQIQEVRPGLAAARAGVRVGDVVKTFAGKKITDFEQLVNLIKTFKPGDKVSMTVIRTVDGSKQDLELQITLDSWDAAARKARPAVPLPKRKR
ncbi:MAG: PDZ domain-containing protein [Planctomycetaceae bacterium]